MTVPKRDAHVRTPSAQARVATPDLIVGCKVGDVRHREIHSLLTLLGRNESTNVIVSLKNIIKDKVILIV